MTTRTITFDDEHWQVVPKQMTEPMRDRFHEDIRILCDPQERTADIQNDLYVWSQVLAAAPEPETCFCDEKSIGDPAKSCGDCPRDYGMPTVRANPEPPMALGTQTLQGVEMTTKHIPFDLERALAGDALVTRSGMTVLNFRFADKGDIYYPYEATIHSPVEGPIDEWFTKEGRLYAHDDADECPDDLFMAENAPKPRYMVSVDGRTAPRIVHDDKASAVTEAERLMNAGAGDVIRVLRVERTLRRRVITEWSEE